MSIVGIIYEDTAI